LHVPGGQFDLPNPVNKAFLFSTQLLRALRDAQCCKAKGGDQVRVVHARAGEPHQKASGELEISLLNRDECRVEGGDFFQVRIPDPQGLPPLDVLVGFPISTLLVLTQPQQRPACAIVRLNVQQVPESSLSACVFLAIGEKHADVAPAIRPLGSDTQGLQIEPDGLFPLALALRLRRLLGKLLEVFLSRTLLPRQGHSLSDRQSK
jgi:hypothetical protein